MPNVSLSKSARALLSSAKKTGRCGYQTSIGRGPQGGAIRTGLRQRKAFQELAAAGLLCDVSTSSSVHPMGNGYSVTIGGGTARVNNSD